MSLQAVYVCQMKLFRIWNLNLFCLIIIIINSLLPKHMSYVYPLYGFFDPFSQALYPLIIQTDLSTPIPSIYSPNKRSPTPEPQEAPQFKPIVISTATTLQSFTQVEPKARVRRQGQERKETSRIKDQSFGWRNQNKDRNLISSILKGYTQQLQQSQGMLKLVQNLAKKRFMENGVSRFLQYVAQKFPSRKSYVGLRYMHDALIEQPFKEDMSFILNVTLRHYLTETYPLQVVETTKLRKRERLGLLKKARSIRALLFAS